MFKQALIFRISPEFQCPPAAHLEEALKSRAFLPCSPTQPESSGWVAPRGNASAVLCEVVDGQVILRLRTERRAVPASAINEAVAVKVEQYKKETGRERVAAKIKKDFKEEAILDLLPRAFSKFSNATIWLDLKNHFLVVDSVNLTGADRIISHLVDTLVEMNDTGGDTGLKVRQIQTAMTASAAMSHWLSTREAPYNFTVDRDCELKMPDDQKATVRYSRHTLEIDEVVQHIAEGKLPVQVALTWNDRVSFVLGQFSEIKKIKLLDVVMDGAPGKDKDGDGFDADATIATGELSALIPDLLEALGGELAEEATPATA